MARACVCLAALYLFGLCVLPGRPAAGPGAGAPARLNLEHSTSFVVYPADANHLGTLFGGKTLAEMDRAAGIAVRRLLYGSAAKRAVTARIDGVRFLRPGRVGDLVFLECRVEKLEGAEVGVHVAAAREADGGARETLARGVFTFVAIDPGTGKPAGHGLKLPTQRKP
jgi:acyl-CoA thioesterase YciA